MGITTNIEKRVRQHGNPELLHKEGPYQKIAVANREKQIKKWTREKKIQLISKGTGKLR